MKRISPILTVSAIFLFGLYSFNLSRSVVKHDSYTVASDFPSNPPLSKTGAPGETTCTDCHSGSIQSGNGTINFIYDDGLNTGYLPGETYIFEIGIDAGIQNGFQVTILDDNDIKAGTFIAGANTSIGLSAGKQYIGHSASTNITNWQFQWTAPVTAQGNLRAYYSFNKSNGNSTTSGDIIYVGNKVLLEQNELGFTKIDENPFEIETIWNRQTQQIYLDYNLKSYSSVIVNVQSLNGQLIQTTSIGYQAPGQYHQTLAVKSIPKGIYLVSVFVDNHILNRKMMLD